MLERVEKPRTAEIFSNEDFGEPEAGAYFVIHEHPGSFFLAQPFAEICQRHMVDRDIFSGHATPGLLPHQVLRVK